MVYRRRYRNVRSVSDDELRAFITDHIENMTSQANRRESVSYMVMCIRDAGLYIPTRAYEAESVFERLGFHLHRDRNGYGSVLRTYVQLKGASDGEGKNTEQHKEKGRLVSVKFEDVTCNRTNPGEACTWPECTCL